MTSRGISKSASGQSLVEFVLLIPLLFVLIVNTVNFGGFLFAWITVADAARNGIQYYTAGWAAAGSPAPRTATQVASLVASDVFSLLNRASVTVRVCTNQNGVTICTGPGSSVPPTDPEPSTYLSAMVDVGYTYQPFISLFDFTSMGVQATLPGAVIHSRVAMRVVQ